MLDIEKTIPYKQTVAEIQSWHGNLDEYAVWNLFNEQLFQMNHDMRTFSDDVHESWRGAMVSYLGTMIALFDNCYELVRDFDTHRNAVKINEAIDAVNSWDKANNYVGADNS